MLAATVQAQYDRLCKEAVEMERCLICLEPPHEPTVLPCGHSFCTGCVSELRAKGVSDSCPACRAPLPPGAEKLYDLAFRVWQRVCRAAWCGTPSNGAWRKLSASEQNEMDGAIVMLQEAMDQVRWAFRLWHAPFYGGRALRGVLEPGRIQSKNVAILTDSNMCSIAHIQNYSQLWYTGQATISAGLYFLSTFAFGFAPFGSLRVFGLV